jgi:hypothetical protein
LVTKPIFFPFSRRRLLSQLFVQVLGQLVEELKRVKVVCPGDIGHSSLDAESEVLGIVAGLDGLDADGFERLCKLLKRLVLVELGAVQEATRPGKDGSDRVGRRLFALLVEPNKRYRKLISTIGFIDINSYYYSIKKIGGHTWI